MAKRINVRAKGANGEREAGKWLAAAFKLSKVPERNLEQVRSGGHDLNGFPPFCIEVKRCETLSKKDWWLQVTKAARENSEGYVLPVVMYRQSNQPWRFLISAKYIGARNGFVELEERVFKMWVETVLQRLSDKSE